MQNQHEPQATASLVPAVLMAPLALAAWRVGTSAHPTLGEVGWLAATYYVALFAVVIVGWLAMRELRAARERSVQFSVQFIAPRIGRRSSNGVLEGILRYVVARYGPAAAALAILLAVGAVGGAVGAVATHTPGLARDATALETVVDLGLLFAAGLWVRRWRAEGGRVRVPRSTWRAARRLAPRETGWLVDPLRYGVPGPNENAPAMAVIGPSGSGKTQLLGLLAATWPGAVLVASTKADLFLEAAVGKRLQFERNGWPLTESAVVWDPTHQLASHWGRADWDPSYTPSGSSRWAHANEIARALAADHSAQGSAAFWSARGQLWLAPLLTWADIRGGGVADILRLLLACGPEELGAQLELAVEELSAAKEHTAAQTLRALTAQLADAATARRANDELAQALAVLQPMTRQLEEVPTGRRLDLGAWAASSQLAGVVVSAHVGRHFGPVVAAFVEDAVAALRATPHSVPALVVLDEVANIANLPALTTWATELRGWGAFLIVAAQSSRQLAPWDPARTEDWLLSTFGRVLVAAGAAELGLAERIAAAHGVRHVQRTHATTTWTETEPALRPHEVFASQALRGGSARTRTWVDIYRGQRIGTHTVPPCAVALAPLAAAVERERVALERRQQQRELRRARPELRSKRP